MGKSLNRGRSPRKGKMEGCLKFVMIALSIVLGVVLAFQVYNLVEGNENPTKDEMFEIVIYSCCTVICVLLVIELFKWGSR